MIVTYALPVIEEAIPSACREVEISSDSKMWKDDVKDELSSQER